MKNLITIAIALLLSCNSRQGERQENNEKESSVDTTVLKGNVREFVDMSPEKEPSSFLDSIASRSELSVAQIRRHKVIDSVYYTGIHSDVGFTGDTVFSFYGGFKGAIINYDDRRSCIYKFLLVMDSVGNESLDGKIIYTDCDHDESADFTMLRYKLVNDSVFETTETFIPANKKDRQIAKQKWQVNNAGKIGSIR